MQFQLVKMEGDYVERPHPLNLVRRLIHKWKGKKYMPADPRNHPDCLEIIEGNDRTSRTVYKRNG